MKELRQTRNIVLNTAIFIILISSAFAIDLVFGLGFVLGFLIILYNKDIKRKPWKMILIFIGALITRFALGQFITTIPNYEITLNFIIAIVMIILLFIFGWKIKRV